MRRLAEEPLFHFLLLGGALLGLDALIEPAPEPRAPLVADEGVRRRLHAEFTAANGRAPTDAERQAAVERHLDEEALFRTALALGLHETDLIVRRRLIQRMRFLQEESAELREPTDAELEAFLSENPSAIPEVRVLSFEHRFFARSSRGANLDEDAAGALAELRAGGQVGGDLLPRRVGTEAVRLHTVARHLGRDVADAFFAAPDGTWAEPIRSVYGLHLVRVTERQTHRAALADVRERARALWHRQQRDALGRELTASVRRGLEGSP